MSSYKTFVKPFYREEPMDFLFYRPFAYLIVQLFQKLPLTPNLFSLMALTVAWTADILLLKGDYRFMPLAGVGILAFGVFDCCDGMWARWKGNPYPYGDLIDMFIDLLACAGHIFTLVYLGSSHDSGPYIPFAAGLMLLFHASLYNDRKLLFDAATSGDPGVRTAQVRKYRAELARLENLKQKPFSRFLMKFFLLFASAQSAERKLPELTAAKVSKLKRALPIWGSVAGATHLSVLAISLILGNPNYYYFFALIIANIIISIAWAMERG